MGLRAIGRLKPGVTIEQASADTGAIANSLTAEYPEADKGVGVGLVPLKRRSSVTFTLSLGIAGRGGIRFADCLRERGEPAACAGDRAHARICDSRGLGSNQGTRDSPAVDGERLAGVCGRRVGSCRGMGNEAGAEDIAECVAGCRPRLGSTHTCCFYAWNLGLCGNAVWPGAGAGDLAPGSSGTLKEGGRGQAGRAPGAGRICRRRNGAAVVLLVGAGLMVRSLYIFVGSGSGLRSPQPAHI